MNSILMIAYTNYRTDPRVIREAEAAVQAGFDVDFLVLRRDGEPAQESINGVRVNHLNQQRFRGKSKFGYLFSYLEFFLRCMFAASLLHWKRRYSIVHVNNMPDLLVFATLPIKLFGAKVILDIHDPMPNTFASKYRSADSGLLFKALLFQEKASVWFADAVVTVQEPVRDHVLIKQHRLPPEKVMVVANFADDQLFAFQAPAPIGDRIKLVFHGTILERYGLGAAMVALANARLRSRITITIIGEGDFSERLKALIVEHRLSDSVHFLNKMIPLHEIPAILAQHNVGFVPLEISSITDFALPLKLLEYTSVGLPSITVPSRAIRHYFGQSDCFFYDPTNIETLTALFDRIAENPQLIADQQGRVATIRERYLWSTERRKYVDLLNRLSGIRSNAVA